MANLKPLTLPALETSRTPPTTAVVPSFAKRSTIRRPVCPVAPATRTFLGSKAFTGEATNKAPVQRLRRGRGAGVAFSSKKGTNDKKGAQRRPKQKRPALLRAMAGLLFLFEPTLDIQRLINSRHDVSVFFLANWWSMRKLDLRNEDYDHHSPTASPNLKNSMPVPMTVLQEGNVSIWENDPCSPGASFLWTRGVPILDGLIRRNLYIYIYIYV